MTRDTKHMLRVLDRLEPPELWERIARGTTVPMHNAAFERSRAHHRVTAGVVALAIAAAAVWIAFVAFRPTKQSDGLASRQDGALANGRIAFTRRLPERWNLFTVNPDGSDEQQVTSGARDYASSWSPDGTKLAVDTEQGVTVMNADGSDPVTITPAGGSTPAWAPDGTKILFTEFE